MALVGREGRRRARVPDALEPPRNARRVRVALAEGVGGEVVELVVVLGQAEPAGADGRRGEVGLEQVVERGSRGSGWLTGTPVGRVRAPCGRRSGSGRGPGTGRASGSARGRSRGRGGSGGRARRTSRRAGACPRNRSCAWSAVALGGMQPDPLRDPLDVAVDRHQRRAEAEQQHDRGGLLADAVDRGQPVARLEGGQVAEELERVVAALLADVAQRRLDAWRLLRAEAARAG